MWPYVSIRDHILCIFSLSLCLSLHFFYADGQRGQDVPDVMSYTWDSKNSDFYWTFSDKCVSMMSIYETHPPTLRELFPGFEIFHAQKIEEDVKSVKM
jgi:hypothetical protein